MEGFDDLFGDMPFGMPAQVNSAPPTTGPNSNPGLFGIGDIDDLMGGDFLDLDNNSGGMYMPGSSGVNTHMNQSFGLNAGLGGGFDLGPISSTQPGVLPALQQRSFGSPDEMTFSPPIPQQYASTSASSAYLGIETLGASHGGDISMGLSPLQMNYAPAPASAQPHLQAHPSNLAAGPSPSAAAAASSSMQMQQQFSAPQPLAQRGNVFSAAATIYSQLQHHTAIITAVTASSAQAGAGAGDDNDNDDDGDEDEEDEDDGEDGGDAAGSGAGGSGKAGKGQGGGSMKGLTAEERRIKRLERNRESARQSRRRKKQYLELLEQRVGALQQQIYELRTAHSGAAQTALEEQRRRLLLSLEPVAYKDSCSPDEEASLNDAAAQLVDRFGPDCPERRAVREFHFDQLHRLLLPPHTKFLLWLIHQPQDFFHSPGDDSGNKAKKGDKDTKDTGRSPLTLWTLLCAEIGLSSEQADKLRQQLRRVLGGPDVPRETWRLGVAAAYLQRLRAAVAAAAAKAQSHLEKVKDILTPAQLIRYLSWMETNKERVSRAIEQTVVPPAPAPPAAAQQQQQGPGGAGGAAAPGASAAGDFAASIEL